MPENSNTTSIKNNYTHQKELKEKRENEFKKIN